MKVIIGQIPLAYLRFCFLFLSNDISKLGKRLMGVLIRIHSDLPTNKFVVIERENNKPLVRKYQISRPSACIILQAVRVPNNHMTHLVITYLPRRTFDFYIRHALNIISQFLHLSLIFCLILFSQRKQFQEKTIIERKLTGEHNTKSFCLSILSLYYIFIIHREFLSLDNGTLVFSYLLLLVCSTDATDGASIDRCQK